MSFLQRITRNIISKRTFTKSAVRRDEHDLGGEPGKHSGSLPNFGFFFDIDGVIVRGKEVLPSAVKSFKRLIGQSNEFRVPTVFVTNDGNMLRRDKASDLSKWLGININEDQVVLSYSPLSLMEDLKDKRVLVSGQGHVEQILSNLGFRNFITIDTLVQNFPSLDYVNKNKRNPVNGPVNLNFQKIDGIILLNEPINWETSLQLLVDLLITNGMPSALLHIIPYPHIFIIACNMDLLWMSKAPIPRYGHGAFLLCLESLYEKVSGHTLMYTAMIGKPSILTYGYANTLLQNHARKIGIPHVIQTIYAVGDNINTDVCGANLYNRYLKMPEIVYKDYAHLMQDRFKQAHRCFSILVETGVHCASFSYSEQHSHTNFIGTEEHMNKPDIVTRDVGYAIDTVFKLEDFQ